MQFRKSKILSGFHTVFTMIKSLNLYDKGLVRLVFLDQRTVANEPTKSSFDIGFY